VDKKIEELLERRQKLMTERTAIAAFLLGFAVGAALIWVAR
jgi:hypothetical protein